VPAVYEDMSSTGTYYSCNGGSTYYYDLTHASSWTSNNTPVIAMDSSVHYRADGIAGGTANVTGSYTGCSMYDSNPDFDCPCINSTQRSSSSTADVVTVKIQTQSNSNNYVFVGADSSVATYNTQFAVGIPNGGSYAWTVSPESVSISPNNSTNAYLVTFTGSTPSASVGSTTEHVTYTYSARSPSDSRAITLRKFSALTTPSAKSGCPDYPNPPAAGQGYLQEFIYNILTNPGLQQVQSGFPGISVSEAVNVSYVAPQGTQVSLQTGGAPTSSTSQIYDCLGIPSSTALPSNLVVCETQTISVGGIQVRTNTLKFTNTSVSIVASCP